MAIWPARTMATILLLLPASARAEPVAVSTSVTVNLLDGKHDTGGTVDRLDFVPLPLAVTDVRLRRTTLHLEGLPALTLRYDDGSGGTQATRLSIINATVRRSFIGGVFAGIGQTVYNQRTTYDERASVVVDTQSSRVTGLRLEAGFIHAIGRTTRFEGVFAFNPAMRGLERTQLRFAPAGTALLNSERAMQVDTSAYFATAAGHGDVVYGVRYLNYTSRYVVRGTRGDGELADRNAGFMPLVGYRYRW